MVGIDTGIDMFNEFEVLDQASDDAEVVESLYVKQFHYDIAL